MSADRNEGFFLHSDYTPKHCACRTCNVRRWMAQMRDAIQRSFTPAEIHRMLGGRA